MTTITKRKQKRTMELKINERKKGQTNNKTIHKRTTKQRLNEGDSISFVQSLFRSSFVESMDKRSTEMKNGRIKGKKRKKASKRKKVPQRNKEKIIENTNNKNWREERK